MEWLTFMITRSLHDPVCHPGHWEGVRPWLRPFAAGRGPDRMDDRPPVEEQANMVRPKAGALLSHKHTESEIHGVNRDKGVRSTTQNSGA